MNRQYKECSKCKGRVNNYFLQKHPRAYMCIPCHSLDQAQKEIRYLKYVIRMVMIMFLVVACISVISTVSLIFQWFS